MTNDSNQSRENAGSEVLLIEDDVAIRDHIRTILSERHSTVLEAESTLQIMKLIDLRSWNWRPRAAVVDLVLPGGTSGYDAIRRLRARFSEIPLPIIVVSRLSSSNDVLEAQYAGANSYVPKPITRERFLAAFDFAEQNIRQTPDEREHAIKVF